MLCDVLIQLSKKSWDSWANASAGSKVVVRKRRRRRAGAQKQIELASCARLRYWMHIIFGGGEQAHTMIHIATSPPAQYACIIAISLIFASFSRQAAAIIMPISISYLSGPEDQDQEKIIS